MKNREPYIVEGLTPSETGKETTGKAGAANTEALAPTTWKRKKERTLNDGDDDDDDASR